VCDSKNLKNKTKFVKGGRLWLFAQLAEAEEQNNIVIMMADDGGDDNVFVYMGGNQEVPEGVTRAVVDPSVDTILRGHSIIVDNWYR
jgi:hypothetical protein